MPATADHLAPGFADLLGSHDVAELQAHTGSICGLWPDYRIAYVNPAWFTFGLDNGSDPDELGKWGLNANLMQALPPSLVEFYRANFDSCLHTGCVWTHQYECSSADRYRRFHQIVYPLERGAGLLVVHSLVLERVHNPAERASCPPSEAYRGAGGFLVQCAHCRRMRHGVDPDRWDWVPEWVERPQSATSHTVCPPCFSHYYPDVAAS